MNFNPMQLISFIRSNSNPQQLTLNLLQQQASNNPFFANILNLAKSNRGGDIETIARNMLKERGLDFDTEFNKFRHNFNL